MQKVVRKIRIILIAAAVFAAAGFAYIQYSAKYKLLDGPGSVYQWTDYELYTEWVEVGPDTDDPARLKFSKDSFTLSAYGETRKYKYSLPDGIDVTGKPEGNVYIEFGGCMLFERLIFHEDGDLEDSIPVLSGTVFEYDGRGEIISYEFVRKADLDKVPEDFRSSLREVRNDRTPVPTFVTLTPDDSVNEE